MTSVVVETEQTTVYFTPGTSDFLIISFRGMNTDARHGYWGQPLMEQLGFNCLGIAPTQPTWYPREEMLQVSEALSPWLNQFNRRLGYGFSMGGYGALAHSEILGLTDILAFGPQWSIDPQKVSSFDRRYIGNFTPQNKGMELSVKEDINTFLVYDPLNREDFEHVQRIDPRRACKHIKVYGGSHKTTSFVVGAERMKTIIGATLAQDDALLSRSMRLWKKAHPRYLDNVQARWKERSKKIAVSRQLREVVEPPQNNPAPNSGGLFNELRQRVYGLATWLLVAGFGAGFDEILATI